VVVSPLADVQESSAQLVRRLLAGGPVLLALICAAVWVLVGYTLRTVERLREQVAQLSVTGLADRVKLPIARDEVRQLAVTMNDLLERLQGAAMAQRRFVADAAHELRTPLAALRTRLEVGERAGDPAGWDRAVPVLIRDAERLGQLIDDLLALARLDESPRLAQPVPVDLDDIVFAEVARLRGGAVRLDTRDVSPTLLYGDPDLLRRIVGNLLSNAVRHAEHRVRVSVSTSDGQVELVVADDGPGIPVAERERVFQRFHRLDAARARDGGGSGLGLAIVRDAARAHRGTVTIQDDRPGAVLTVWLPQDHPDDVTARAARPGRPGH
jgi:signal transduction histidine kinase